MDVAGHRRRALKMMRGLDRLTTVPVGGVVKSGEISIIRRSTTGHPWAGAFIRVSTEY